MHRSRTAAASLAALLAVSGTMTVTTGLAAAQTAPPTTVGEPSPTTTAPALPTEFAVTLPGLGDISLSVDPATGAIVSLVVTPIDGVTASDPAPTHGGVRIDFTLADGTVKAIVVEVHARDGSFSVEIETDDGEDGGDGTHSGPPPIDQRGNSTNHRNDGGRPGEHRGTSSTVVSGSSRSGDSTGNESDRRTSDRSSSTTPATSRSDWRRSQDD